VGPARIKLPLLFRYLLKCGADELIQDKVSIHSCRIKKRTMGVLLKYIPMYFVAVLKSVFELILFALLVKFTKIIGWPL
jgi:hypothetical protein